MNTPDIPIVPSTNEILFLFEEDLRQFQALWRRHWDDFPIIATRLILNITVALMDSAAIFVCLFLVYKAVTTKVCPMRVCKVCKVYSYSFYLFKFEWATTIKHSKSNSKCSSNWLQNFKIAWFLCKAGCVPALVPELVRLRQVLCIQDDPGLQREFQDIQTHTEKLCPCPCPPIK